MLPGKHDLTFSQPLLNAAGFRGFVPDLLDDQLPDTLGAFVTNPISLRPRYPAEGSRLLPFSGGFLLHTGHPNPGIRATVQRYRRRWVRSSLPILVHFLAEDPGSLSEAMQILELVEGVMGVEIGLPPDIDSTGVGEFGSAARGELPFILRIPLADPGQLAEAAGLAGAAAISLAPPRGALPDSGGKVVSGRLYGGAVYPLALAAVSRLAGIGIPIIAAGGVSTRQDAQALIDAGAAAVMLDFILWKPGNFIQAG